MDRLTLIFGADLAYLGELTTQDGVMSRFILTNEGEARLGDSIEEWQTQGIAVLVHRPGAEAGEDDAIVDEKRIQPRLQEFADAFRHWCALRGLKVVDLSESHVPCWEKILRLPFVPMERHAMISAVCRLPSEDISAWMNALDEAYVEVEKVK